VMAERPDTGQLTIDDCTALSHRISDLFDTLEGEGRDPIDEPYRLEVSSPGIDRPLTRLSDFTNWVGHDARVVLNEGVVPAGSPGDSARKNLSGRISGHDGDQITIIDRKTGALTFAFSDIVDAKLILTDRLIAASRPIDATGADEILETELETTETED
jgi:ribosome maturation factor RimP